MLKPGGWVIFNGLWLPHVKGLRIVDPIDIPAQPFSSFRNVCLLIYLKKVNEGLIN